MHGIANSAERFDLVPGFKTIRVAKVWSLGLRIVFQISGIKGEQVKLKWIERMDQPGIFDDDEEEF